ncbi:hypothetical protein ACPDHL_06085 [Myroides sp. C15-4]|uniref:hypothetical protein n=1 Tax=Myroides sp. C15-4 TaxID=3400532 RepID=UPI003D2F5FE2
MRKLLFVLPFLFLFLSCEKKEMKLARAAYIVEEGVDDHSPIYIEFAEDGIHPHLNDNNRIGGTNFIFHVERELNLKEVVEMIQGVKDKKYDKNSMHPDEKGVFYSYADTLNKHLSFFPFKTIDYVFERPTSTDNLLYVNASNDLFFEGQAIDRNQLQEKVQGKDSLQLGFSKELNFENYLQMRVLIEELKLRDQVLDQDKVY